MDNQDWLIITTIAEEKSITKASEKLYISQPALTYRLKHIEEEIGVTLFFRTVKGVFLTPEGEVIKKYAIEMLSKFHDVQKKLEKIKDNVTNKVRIGILAMFAYVDFKPILSAFQEEHPQTNIFLMIGTNDQMIEALCNDQIDIAIVVDKKGINEKKILLPDVIECIIYNQQFTLADLQNLPRVLYMPKSPNIQAELDKWWFALFQKPYTIGTGVNDIGLLYQAVRSGFGWATVSTVDAKRNLSQFYYKELAWQDGKPFSWPMVLLHKTANSQNKIAEIFIKHISEWY
ncbi:MAG: LysR family transcriptional regulator [Acidaminococcaceae bacterium]